MTDKPTSAMAIAVAAFSISLVAISLSIAALWVVLLTQ